MASTQGYIIEKPIQSILDVCVVPWNISLVGSWAGLG